MKKNYIGLIVLTEFFLALFKLNEVLNKAIAWFMSRVKILNNLLPEEILLEREIDFKELIFNEKLKGWKETKAEPLGGKVTKKESPG